MYHQALHVPSFVTFFLLLSSARALIINEPKPVNTSAITTDGLAAFTWTTEPGDPSFIDLVIQGASTNFTIGTNVSTSNTPGSLTRRLTEIPSAQGYELVALDPSDDSVVSRSPAFEVLEEEPSAAYVSLVSVSWLMCTLSIVIASHPTAMIGLWRTSLDKCQTTLGRPLRPTSCMTRPRVLIVRQLLLE